MNAATDTPEAYLLSLPTGTRFTTANGTTLMQRTADGYDIAEDTGGPLSPAEQVDYAAEILCTQIGLLVRPALTS